VPGTVREERRERKNEEEKEGGKKQEKEKGKRKRKDPTTRQHHFGVYILHTADCRLQIAARSII